MAAEVASIEDKYLYSLSQLATVFGIARETVGKRLQQACVIPAGERRNHAVYHIGAASRAIIEGDNSSAGAGQIDDPEKLGLAPKDRLDWFKSENEKDKLHENRKLLITADDSRAAIVDVIKIFVQPLEALGDTMEREGILSIDALERFEGVVDDIREDLADKLEAYELRQSEQDS